MSGLIYNGVELEDFGIYIDTSPYFNKPVKKINKVSIPGRNGDLILDENEDVYENLTLVFPCFIRDGFAEKYDDLVNFLAQTNGYHVLECDKDPSTYREAAVSTGWQPETGAFVKHGKFNLTFDCKPQMFLKSGTVPMQFIPDYKYGVNLQFSTFYMPTYNQTDLTFTVHCKSTDTPTIKVDHCDSSNSVLRTSTFTTSDGYSNTVSFQNDVAYWRMYCTDNATVYNEMNVNIKTVTVYDNKPLAIDAVWCRYVTISNPTGYRAMPLIEIYANLVSQFRINNDLNGERLSHFYFYSTEKIPNVTHFYMDCELQYMYDDDGNNLSNYLYIEDGETEWHEGLVFPFFEGDEIKINWEHYDYQGLELAGLGLVNVYPHWWKL